MSKYVTYFQLKDSPYTRLCSSKSILTVNGQFPGPTLYVTEGDTLIVDVINRASENVTIHWYILIKLNPLAQYLLLLIN